MGYMFSRRKRLRKSNDAEAMADLLQKLRRFLDAKEPGLVKLLVNTFQTQGKAISYKELREAILAGDISVELWQEWQQDYARFVVEHLQPQWKEAMETAAQITANKYPGWHFDPMTDGIREWTEQRAADFVTSVSNTQIEGLRAVIHKATAMDFMGVDELAKVIRPMVGLTKPQAVANLKYYTNLIDSGRSVKKAQELSLRYAARQNRYRGMMIARTELSFAYNQGSYEAIKQAQDKGYMGEVVKVWCTADDERSHECSICSALEGVEIAMDDDFNFHTKLATPNNPTICRVPPAHPNCRCTVLYKEKNKP